jgi:hypothetical protein
MGNNIITHNKIDKKYPIYNKIIKEHRDIFNIKKKCKNCSLVKILTKSDLCADCNRLYNICVNCHNYFVFCTCHKKYISDLIRSTTYSFGSNTNIILSDTTLFTSTLSNSVESTKLAMTTDDSICTYDSSTLDSSTYDSSTLDSTLESSTLDSSTLDSMSDNSIKDVSDDYNYPVKSKKSYKLIYKRNNHILNNTPSEINESDSEYSSDGNLNMGIMEVIHYDSSSSNSSNDSNDNIDSSSGGDNILLEPINMNCCINESNKNKVKKQVEVLNNTTYIDNIINILCVDCNKYITITRCGCKDRLNPLIVDRCLKYFLSEVSITSDEDINQIRLNDAHTINSSEEDRYLLNDYK